MAFIVTATKIVLKLVSTKFGPRTSSSFCLI